MKDKFTKRKLTRNSNKFFKRSDKESAENNMTREELLKNSKDLFKKARIQDKFVDICMTSMLFLGITFITTATASIFANNPATQQALLATSLTSAGVAVVAGAAATKLIPASVNSERKASKLFLDAYKKKRAEEKQNTDEENE